MAPDSRKSRPRKKAKTRTAAVGAENNHEQNSGEEPVLGPTHEQIKARAYELYVARGRLDGYDFEDWLTAEFELFSRMRGSEQKPS